jgi:hypothetical protein
LKGLFKAVATTASVRPGPLKEFYQASLANGIKPTMARLTLAPKIAAITLTLSKKGENFNTEKLKLQAAQNPHGVYVHRHLVFSPENISQSRPKCGTTRSFMTFWDFIVPFVCECSPYQTSLHLAPYCVLVVRECAI